MQSAQDLGLFGAAKRQEYVYIFVRTLEIDYNDVVCSGNLTSALPLFLETTSNAVFVSFPFDFLHCFTAAIQRLHFGSRSGEHGISEGEL